MDNSVLTKWPIEDIISSLKGVLGGFPGIVAGYLFGSYARGEENPMSDLDIAVLFQDKVGLAEELKLSRLVGGILKDKKVDVATLNDKPVTFQFEVLSTGYLIYDPHPEEEIKFRWSVIRRYLDIKPSLDLFWKLFDHYLKEEYPVEGK